MAAATLDLLLAMAISSQVSVFVSRGFGSTGDGLHWRGGGRIPKESTARTHIHSGNDLEVLKFKSTELRGQDAAQCLIN